MNRRILSKIISTLSVLGIGTGSVSNASQYGLTSGIMDNAKNDRVDKTKDNLLNQNPTSQDEGQSKGNLNKEENTDWDFDILTLALNPGIWDNKPKKIEHNENPIENSMTNRKIYDSKSDLTHLTQTIDKIITVEYQQNKAEEALEEWSFMSLAFKSEKFNVYEKLFDFGFKDLSKLKRNAEKYSEYIHNFFEKESQWDELVLDGVTVRKNDQKSHEILYNLDLFIFYDHFDLMDSVIDRLKNFHSLLNDEKMFSIIKDDVEKYWGSSNIILNEQPREFYVWSWINIIFSEANLQWRSRDISIHRNDPSNPLNNHQLINMEKLREPKFDENGVHKHTSLVIELH